MPRQVRKASNDGYYQGYNLSMTYEGNMLTSVRDNASHHSYAGAMDFDGAAGQEYPLTYNDAGSLVSDAGRRIAKIEYDLNNNPVRIQFTNGNVTKYIYSATGEKLRVTYQTAVPNITVAIGSSRELSSSEIQCTDYTDYLLGGSLTLKNGRIDKYQFEEGYCQAAKDNATQDNFTFCYYDQDHLGNIRQVTKADRKKNGTVIQAMNYYPFGAQFCVGSADNNIQSHKYNGKELDLMHGLNTYDYGARQYNPVTARWDRMDPLAEKYYGISPYAYCANNPVLFVDIRGLEPGTLFKTRNEAAIDFGKFYNPFSIRENREYGSFILYNPNNKMYYYLKAVGGENDGINGAFRGKNGHKMAASIHTHGAHDQNFVIDGIDWNDNFSGMEKTPQENLNHVPQKGYDDISSANQRKMDSYVVTPNGNLKLYNYQT